MMNKSTKSIILILTLLSLVAGSSQRVLAFVASSTNYQLEKDSLNFGGTDNSTSTSFSLSDSLGEIATGDFSSDDYNLRAGYRAMEVDAITLTLSSPGNISLAAVNKDDGGVSAGTVSWIVATNNSAGYGLSIKASTNPALKSSSDSFADYIPAGANPDYNWTVASSASEFGFTPEGDDIVDRFKDNGSACNAGAGDTSARCWQGFSTTDTTIAENNASVPGGVATTVRVQAEVGTEATLSEGSYSATLTVTAITL